MAHRRRILFPNEQSRLLEALTACRNASTAAMASAPINGPTYITLAALLESLDNVAATLTGSLDYLHGPRTGDSRPTP